MKKIIALLLVLVMALSLAACGSSESTSTPTVATEAATADDSAGGDEVAASGDFSARDDGVFRIGVCNFFGGTPIAPEQDIAYELALEKYGNQVNGEEIEIILYDTLNDPTEAVTGIQYLLGQNVDAVICSFQSSDTVAVKPYLEDSKTFGIMPCTSGSMVTADDVYTFRGANNANSTAKAYAQTAVDLGYQNVAVFWGQDEASASNWNDAVKQAFADAGLTVVAEETGTSKDTDYSAQCMKIVAANPDVVYVVCESAGTNFVKQLREYGYNGIIMSKDEWMTSHVSSIGEENSQFILSQVPYTTYTSIELAKESGASENVLSFLADYEAKTGELPTVGITYRLYDSMLIVLEAATRAGCNYDSDKLAEACLTISDLQGCMGTINFTRGDREPASEFTSIIYYQGGSKSFEAWMTNGGYDDYLATTGRAK